MMGTGDFNVRGHTFPGCTYIESDDGDLVDRIQGLDVVRGCQTSDSHEPINVDTFGEVRIV